MSGTGVVATWVVDADGRDGSEALQRYSSAMATIQVREVPEESYEVLRRRARRSGQSIQAYMREQVIALADLAADRR
jgi:hypothetical protein